MSTRAPRKANGACLQVRGLGKSFGVNGRRMSALEDISFEVRSGEVLGILGPSGCGKTTLLNIIAGFLPHDQGQVLMHGQTVTRPGPERGVVFQEDALFPWLTVAENVGFGLRNGDGRAGRRIKVERMLDLVGLEGFGSYLPSAISGGMKQRVALARVLVLQPAALLMDEPFAALDAQTRGDMHSLLISLQRQLQQTVVFVTHDPEEAVKLADRVLVMATAPGRLRQEHRVDLERPRQVDSAAFLEIKRAILDGLGGS
ncbi:MAG: ABC transporter ATP-binding protein [Desulfarculaceae bacterium]|nr:ABC transporter ATP-binding protein [Desulfarculaceae bacterium]MCF8072885.1 ABC transporter ATP-binding protein [Desulfarculaceae bacterium]MCF8101053.1 ABC transporter ATP-binding protein [Desulfarculaceae bacterium]MCF8115560.1 ABC transporter ATP-binding protein [Desulfarculaceae bacterium]